MFELLTENIRVRELLTEIIRCEELFIRRQLRELLIFFVKRFGGLNVGPVLEKLLEIQMLCIIRRQ